MATVDAPDQHKDDDTTTGFGAWVRSARKARGWTIDLLADKSESAGPALSNLERGVRNPSRDMIDRIARALGETDEHYERLKAEGLIAAGFLPEGGYRVVPELESIPDIDAQAERLAQSAIGFLQGYPPQVSKRAAQRILELTEDAE